MTPVAAIDVRPEAAEALRAGRPVVALETTLVAHGLPWPLNLETARAAEAVVCAGAKGILDLTGTLEGLETNGVPVVGYRTDDFPAFYVRSSGLPVAARVDSPAEAAALVAAHWALDGAGVVLAQPLPEEEAL